MKKTIFILALIAMFVFACSPATPTAAAVTQQPTDVPQATIVPATEVPTPVPPSETPAPTLTATPAAVTFPPVTFSEKTICRKGPDKNFYAVVTFAAGESSKAEGRNEDGTWLSVLSQEANQNRTCWIPTASVQAFGDVTGLIVSVSPSLPDGPTTATASDQSSGVCGVNKRGAVTITWAPVAAGTGYYVYRNGKNIATVYGGEYIDHDTPGSKTAYVYSYVIQGFDSDGLSKLTASVSVTICD